MQDSTETTPETPGEWKHHPFFLVSALLAMLFVISFIAVSTAHAVTLFQAFSVLKSFAE